MIKKITTIFLLVVALTSCSKEATITARTGVGGEHQPQIDCHVTVPNPDYVGPSTSKEP